MYELNRRSLGRTALARFLPIGLAGITVLALAQACKTDPPEDGDGTGGTGGGTGGTIQDGGTGGGTGGADPVTGGSGGTAGDNNGGSAGEGGMGGAVALDFTFESGISMIYPLPSSVMGGAILIDRAASCEAFTDASDAGAYWGDSTSLYLTFGDKDGPALEPGSYPVTNLPAPDEGKYGSATLVTYDSECTQATASAPSGVITITAVDGDEITGSYDLVFADGTLEGTFSPEDCPDFGWSNSSPPTTCY